MDLLKSYFCYKNLVCNFVKPRPRSNLTVWKTTIGLCVFWVWTSRWLKSWSSDKIMKNKIKNLSSVTFLQRRQLFWYLYPWHSSCLNFYSVYMFCVTVTFFYLFCRTTWPNWNKFGTKHPYDFWIVKIKDVTLIDVQIWKFKNTSTSI